MNKKERIIDLVQKLNNETISGQEFNEFLSLVNDDKNKVLFDQVLDQDIYHFYSVKKVKTIRQYNRRRWLVRIGAAASILLLILAGTFFFGPSRGNNLTYTTSNGETLEIELPDHSHVTLNANTELTWMDSKQPVRKVRLSGEAFFDVQHDKEKPFQVYSDEIMIQVLGTSFNVNNRHGKDEIYLQKGRIQIQNKNSRQDDVLLTTGESAYYDKRKTEIIKSTDQRFADQSLWKDGILKFTNVPVEEIFEQLEAIYGIDLEVKDTAFLSTPMDFALPYSRWEVVSEMLALALGKNVIKKKNHFEFIDR